MLGGVQFETGGLGPVPYLNILGGTSQKNHPVAYAHNIFKLFCSQSEPETKIYFGRNKQQNCIFLNFNSNNMKLWNIVS